MNYCENCHIVTEETLCPICESKQLRLVANHDYCFVAEKEVMWAEMYMEILKDNDIPHTYLLVFGAGVTLKTGTIEHYKVYVQFENLERASDLLQIAFTN